MMLTSAERKLFVIYCSGTATETAAVVREALPDIADADENAAAVGLLFKLDGMDGAAFGDLIIESGCGYA